MDKYLYFDNDGFSKVPHESRYKCTPQLRNDLFAEMESLYEPYYNVRIIADENGKPYVSKTPYTREQRQQILRRKRKYCFSVINRGTAWYNSLTETQKQELQEWYQAWLDAPETLIEPEQPTWLK